MDKNSSFIDWLRGKGEFPFFKSQPDIPMPIGEIVCAVCGKKNESYWESVNACSECVRRAAKELSKGNREYDLANEEEYAKH